VPLLAGWNHDEGNYRQFFGPEAPTKENYDKRIEQLYGAKAPDVLKLFPGGTDEQAKQSASQLSTANFIGYGTWKWLEMQVQTGRSSVYRYEFDDAPPRAANAPPLAPGDNPLAYHSAEIEFVFGTLDSKNLPWRPEDHELSDQMASYWTNFAKSGDPNSPDLPQWPQYEPKDEAEVMHLVAMPHAEADKQRAKYLLLDKINEKP
jgi:para-nitrobenzyl esterase